MPSGSTHTAGDDFDALLVDALGGDDDAMRHLLEAIAIPSLQSIAARELRSLPATSYESEDLVQDCLQRLVFTFQNRQDHESAFRGRTLPSFIAFLRTIAVREIARQFRHAHATRRGATMHRCHMPIEGIADSPENGPQRRVELAEMKSRIADAYTKLSPSDREIICMRVVEHRSYEDIAECDGRSAAACRNHFARAKTRLASTLQVELHLNKP